MISVLIICKDEEKYIRRCLDSINWADEIIIIDSYSKDNTINICREFTEKIYQREWNGFSSQRKYGIEKCNGDWILSIDSDEVCTDKLREEIKNLLKLNSISTKINGYFIPRQNIFRNHKIRFGGSYPDYQLRLFRKKFVSVNDRLVHESFVVEGTTSKLKNNLEHYPYRTFKEYLEKINLYSTLSAQEKFNHGKRTNIFKILFKPIFEFKKNYIFQLGLLDGIAGFYKSLFHFLTKLYTEIKIWELQKIQKSKNEHL